MLRLRNGELLDSAKKITMFAGRTLQPFGGDLSLAYPKAWHPYLHSATLILLPPANLGMKGTSIGSGIGTALLAVNAGDHKFFEITVNSFTNGLSIGFGQVGMDYSLNLGDDIKGWAYSTFLTAADTVHNGVTGTFAGATTFAATDIIGVEMDYTRTGGTTCSVSFYKNGILQGTPFTGITGVTLFPACGSTLSNTFNVTANFVGPFFGVPGGGLLPAGATGF